MKKIKSLFAILLAVYLSAQMLCFPAFASDAQTDTSYITYYDDGSYMVTTITYDEQAESAARAIIQKKSGSKKNDYYNSSNQLMWTLWVHGTFNYDGRSAEATYADYSYNIYNSAWSFVSGSAHCSGASAIANGTFSLQGSPYPSSVILTCSPNGTLS